MNNKPKYTIFKNSMYAIDGLKHAVRTETSFKLELFFGFFIFVILIFVDMELYYKLILSVTFFMVMITELLNSAIENVVDLVTTDIHPLAKSAKDLGATAVLFSVILHIACWIFILLEIYN